MTTKEKAIELINNFHPHTNVPKQENAIKCAILAVEELIAEIASCYPIAFFESKLVFWNEVLSELNKMK
jgi:hypothetical protein